MGAQSVMAIRWPACAKLREGVINLRHGDRTLGDVHEFVNIATKEAALTHEQQVAQARTLANQDAKRVAQVVRGWVAQDE